MEVCNFNLCFSFINLLLLPKLKVCFLLSRRGVFCLFVFILFCFCWVYNDRGYRIMQISIFQLLQGPSVLNAHVKLPVAVVNKSRHCLRFNSCIITNLKYMYFYCYLMYAQIWSSFHHASLEECLAAQLTLVDTFVTNTGDKDVFLSKKLMFQSVSDF